MDDITREHRINITHLLHNSIFPESKCSRIILSFNDILDAYENGSINNETYNQCYQNIINFLSTNQKEKQPEVVIVYNPEINDIKLGFK